MPHTPGPWTIDSSSRMMWWVRAGEFEVATVGMKARTRDTHEANARLIAAAPELLAALQGILEIGKRDMSNPKYDGYFESAQRAILTATAPSA